MSSTTGTVLGVPTASTDMDGLSEGRSLPNRDGCYCLPFDSKPCSCQVSRNERDGISRTRPTNAPDSPSSHATAGCVSIILQQNKRLITSGSAWVSYVASKRITGKPRNHASIDPEDTRTTTTSSTTTTIDDGHADHRDHQDRPVTKTTRTSATKTTTRDHVAGGTAAKSTHPFGFQGMQRQQQQRRASAA